MARQPKIFILDTNVILHDYNAIRRFQDNDLVIPVAVVEETDKFKKGNDTLAFNARHFMRDLDRITNGRNFAKGGIQIGKNLGRIKVEPNHPFAPEFADLFKDDIQDHRILSTAMWVRDNNPGRFVALVTKDVNLRMKAKAAGMEVQDYLTDRIEDEKVEKANMEVQYYSLEDRLMQTLCYGPENAIEWKDVVEKKPEANQLFKLRWQKDPDEVACARYDSDRNRIVLIRQHSAYGIKPRNDEQKMALDALMNPKVPLVSLTGGSGTGKTLLALAAALEQENMYDQLIISRPAVTLGNQAIGFLPGNEKTKMAPYLQPLMDNLNVIKSQFRPSSKEAQKIDALLNEERLIIEPLAYIRGRSL
ncbi:MAG: PhoH family protein, partial [Bacteroidales bacterium]|nr:PhoH family protein [Bacteroidales bacterium]